MYLTKLPFLATHRQVMTGFKDFESTQEIRSHLNILFRWENDGTTLIKSDVIPHYEYRGKIQKRPYAPIIEKDGIYRFRFTFRPSVRICKTVKETSITPLVWLGKREKSRSLGGSVLEIKSMEDRDIADRDRSGNAFVFLSSTVEGLFQVQDVEVVQQILKQGYGKGKAYGCGLLTFA
jgi:hypothetical protein